MVSQCQCADLVSMCLHSFSSKSKHTSRLRERQCPVGTWCVPWRQNFANFRSSLVGGRSSILSFTLFSHSLVSAEQVHVSHFSLYCSRLSYSRHEEIKSCQGLGRHYSFEEIQNSLWVLSGWPCLIAVHRKAIKSDLLIWLVHSQSLIPLWLLALSPSMKGT